MKRIVCLILFSIGCSFSEPILITGRMIPRLLKQPVSAIRLINHQGIAIPFQIDERDSTGEYILPSGKEQNAAHSNHVLDSADEIVFLFDDADTLTRTDSADLHTSTISLSRNQSMRFVWATADSAIALSPRSYINYNPASQTVTTPLYYAVFGPNRFHFLRAGIFDATQRRYIDLTAELRIRIQLRALWGLISIAYTEESMICTVKRYKAGPLRLIRRGDFHLNLGLWVEGSRAAVQQICYRDMVSVPVYAKLPIRLKTLFKVAYLEMAPQLNRLARTYQFEVPRYDLRIPLDKDAGDTLISQLPDHTAFTVHNGALGYGWLLNTSIQEHFLKTSGYIVSRKPRHSDSTIGFAGFRIALTDLPAGSYLFSNWVYFSSSGPSGLQQAAQCIQNPIQIMVDSKAAGFNLLSDPPLPRR